MRTLLVLLVAVVALGASDVSAAPLVPARCSPTVAKRLASSLVAAFDRGDVRGVDRIVAPEPAFVWFSAGGATRSARRLGDASKVRSTLAGYVRRRHRQHDRWVAVSLSPLRIRRSADDLETHTGNGKFDTICDGAHAWINVWSI
jgi:hypothetical protein